MKIIDAFWEKRNLGVTCYELSVDANETLDSVKNDFETLEEREYMVAKVHSSNYEVARFFQEQGYTFIETALTMVHDLKEIRLPTKLLKVANRCSWKPMNENDLKLAESEIGKNIFQTDRVFLDPCFTKEQAARRYQLWFKDYVENGDIPYTVFFDGEPIGFFSKPLAAAYSEYKGTGLGFLVLYAGVCKEKRKGKGKAIVHVSGNNPMVFRGYSSLGYKLDTIENVFIKHPFMQK